MDFEIVDEIWEGHTPGSSTYVGLLDRQTRKFTEEAVTMGVPYEYPRQPDWTDIFFTPGAFSHRRTNSELVSFNLLWADLDGFTWRLLTDKCHEKGYPLPNWSWATSENNMQAVWIVHPFSSYDHWAEYNRNLTYTLNADKGGWHGSKYLRVPGSRNWKRNGTYGTQVRYGEQLNDWDITNTHPIKISPRPEKTGPQMVVVPSQEHWNERMASVSDEVYSIVMARAKDRSQAIWDRARILGGLGYSAHDIFTLLWFSPVNKWANSPKQLMADIVKACS